MSNSEKNGKYSSHKIQIVVAVIGSVTTIITAFIASPYFGTFFIKPEPEIKKPEPIKEKPEAIIKPNIDKLKLQKKKAEKTERQKKLEVLREKLKQAEKERIQQQKQ